VLAAVAAAAGDIATVAGIAGGYLDAFIVATGIALAAIALWRVPSVRPQPDAAAGAR